MLTSYVHMLFNLFMVFVFFSFYGIDGKLTLILEPYRTERTLEWALTYGSMFWCSLLLCHVSNLECQKNKRQPAAHKFLLFHLFHFSLFIVCFVREICEAKCQGAIEKNKKLKKKSFCVLWGNEILKQEQEVFSFKKGKRICLLCAKLQVFKNGGCKNKRGFVQSNVKWV